MLNFWLPPAPDGHAVVFNGLAACVGPALRKSPNNQRRLLLKPPPGIFAEDQRQRRGDKALAAKAEKHDRQRDARSGGLWWVGAMPDGAIRAKAGDVESVLNRYDITEKNGHPLQRMMGRLWESVGVGAGINGSFLTATYGPFDKTMRRPFSASKACGLELSGQRGSARSGATRSAEGWTPAHRFRFLRAGVGARLGRARNRTASIFTLPESVVAPIFEAARATGFSNKEAMEVCIEGKRPDQHRRPQKVHSRCTGIEPTLIPNNLTWPPPPPSSPFTRPRYDGANSSDSPSARSAESGPAR